jgi:hypothetical protein
LAGQNAAGLAAIEPTHALFNGCCAATGNRDMSSQVSVDRLWERAAGEEPLMTLSNVDAVALTPSQHQLQLRRAVIASTIGTAIEWYDFFLYSTVTGLVFAKLFFPHSDPWVGTLEAFAIYAAGFLARPVGAAIFGHYGDRIGRKSTLIATLLLMGLATFAVALTVIRQYPKQILLSAFARMAEQAPFYIFTAFIFNDDRLHRQGHFGRISVAVTRGAAPVAMVAI